MPYVIQERRPALNEVVDDLVSVCKSFDDVRFFLLTIANAYSYALLSLAGRKHLKKVVDKAREVDVKPTGDINYILFKYAKYHIEPSYNNYKNFMGIIYSAMDNSTWNYRNEFREAAEWIRIKLLIPYEEKAIERNGDV